MTQEDKKLLLKDLCARLPYDMKVCIKLPNHQEKIFEEHIGDLKELTRYGGYLVNSKGIDYRSFDLDIKPYLRPMSSMTEEELHEYNMHLLGITTGADAVNFMIWIYQHHLDILHFIEKGLALEAPEGMYNLKEK